MAMLNTNRVKLLMSAGPMAVAVSLTLAPERARAQVQATENFVVGVGFRDSCGTDTVFLDSQTTVIDWTPIDDGNGNALPFLPDGNTVVFENSIQPDFAVLNRILPSLNGNVAEINGTVLSQFFDSQSGTVQTAGTIAFYSPTGLIVGSNAVFDVGSLILSGNAIDNTVFQAFDESGGTLTLGDLGGDFPATTVVIQPGAQINALNEGSYFLAVGAEVQMLGTSRVNGSTAFVAGEVININFSNGLFDISVPAGTDIPTPIVVDGDVGGPSSTGAGDNHIIYAVARAAVDPISMLFSGNLGFEPAASAGIVNGEIILSANYDVNGTVIDNLFTSEGDIRTAVQDLGFNLDSSVESTPIGGNIFVEDFAATSTLAAVANDGVLVSALNNASSVDGDLIVYGRNSAGILASNTQPLDVAGTAIVSASFLDVFLSASPLVQGGEAFIDALGEGSITIGGDAFVRADAEVRPDAVNPVVGSAQGGSARISSLGASLNIAGEAFVSANAFSGGSGLAGSVTGGTAEAFTEEGGFVSVGTDLSVGASAFGQGDRAAITAGTVNVQALSGGTLSVTNSIQAVVDASHSLGGETVTGGNISLLASGIGSSIDAGQNFELESLVDSNANIDGRGSDALGGSVSFQAVDGGAILGALARLSVEVIGGDGVTDGGNAVGGFVQVEADTGSINLGAVDLIATATGGEGSSALGAGGSATGGSINLTARGNSQIEFASLNANAFAQSGGGIAAGAATGGDVFVEVGGTSIFSILESVTLGANAVAASGAVNPSATASDANAGAARMITVDTGLVDIGGSFTATASATGGSAGQGGANGLGGAAGIEVITGAVNIAGSALAEANGQGGSASNGFGGDGGDGFGGLAFLQATGTLTETATLTIGGNAEVTSLGAGGAGGSGDGDTNLPGRGGNGFGGSFVDPNQADPDFNNGAFLLAGGDNGFLSVGLDATNTYSVASTGTGGSGGSGGVDQAGGDGGDGTGGTAQVGSAFLGGDGSVAAGAVTLPGLGRVSTIGNGGAGGFGGSTTDPRGNGGIGFGGSSFFTSRAGTVELGAFQIRSDGSGGIGDIGSDGFGGLVAIVGQQSSATSGQFNAIVDAQGGQGTTQAGSASAGTVNFDFDGFDFQPGSLLIDANANFSTGAGDASAGPGSDSFGGAVNLNLVGSDNTITTDVLSITAIGFGGEGNSTSPGGVGVGGFVDVSAEAGAQIIVTNTFSINASGVGGGNSGTGAGGEGEGGRAEVFADTAGLIEAGAINLQSDGTGGNGLGGGAGGGGIAQVIAGTGSIAITADVDVQANGTGGNSNNGPVGGDGGTGIGGRAVIAAEGSLTDFGEITIGGSADAFANGRGGNGGQGDGSTIAAGNGGDGIGGNETILVDSDTGERGLAGIFAGADNGRLTVTGRARAQSIGRGGAGGAGGIGQAGGDGGEGRGGDATSGLLLLGGDGSLGAGTASFDGVVVTADGFGATGAFGDTGGPTTSPRGNGGLGVGGRASFLVEAGQGISASTLSAGADGQGGGGSTGADGTGGEAFVSFRSGNSTVLNSVFVGATGEGRQSFGTTSGSGIGGIAEMEVVGAGTTVSLTGNTLIEAIGRGAPNLDGFDGGAGQGGEASIDVIDGATLNLSTVTFDATGEGENSDGATGGSGTGGTAGVLVEGSSTLIIDTNFRAISNGLGGAGSVVGGNGQGGLAGADVVSGRLEIVGTTRVDANGFAGNGRAFTGADGGVGRGGTAAILAQGTTTDTAEIVLSGTLQMNSDGVGGAGGSAASAADLAGDGGNGFGGEQSTVNLQDPAFPNGVLLLAGADRGSITVIGDATLNSTGVGGQGGDRAGGETAGTGGTGTGGSVQLGVGGIGLFAATDGTLGAGTIDLGNVNTRAGGDGGAGGDNPSTGDATGNGGVGQGGDANLIAEAGTMTVGSLVINSDGFGGVGVIGGDGRGGETNMLGSLGSVATFGALSSFSNGLPGLGSTLSGDGQGGTSTLSLSDSQFTINGDFIATGDAIANATGAGINNATAGSVTAIVEGADSALNVTGQSDLNAFALADNAASNTQVGNAQGGEVFLGVFNGAQAAFTGGLTIFAIASAGNNLDTGPDGDANGGSAIVLADLGGSITGGEIFVDVNAFGSVDANVAGGRAEIRLGSDGAGTLNAATLGILASAFDPEGSTFAGAAGSFDITVLNSFLTVSNLDATAQGTTLSSIGTTPGGGGGSTGPSVLVDGGTIDIIETLSLFTLDDLAIDVLNSGFIGGSTPDIAFDTGGLLSLGGDDSGSIEGGSIFAGSFDIDISGVLLNAGFIDAASFNSSDTAVIGGPDNGPGYTLTQDELLQMSAGQFTFSGPTTSAGQFAPDVLLLDADLAASFNNAAVFATEAGGVLRVEGDFSLRDVTFGSIDLGAGERIEIATPGSVMVLDNDLLPTGSISLDAPSIVVADADFIAEFVESGVPEIATVLASPAAGSEDPLGYLRANTVSIGVANTLLVRNTGTAEEPGGITVGNGGEGGLFISRSESAQTTDDLFVIAYGVGQDVSTGALTTGEDFFAQVDFANTFGASTTYTDESTFNDCVINTATCSTAAPPPPPPPPGGEGGEEGPPVVEVVNNPAVVEAAIEVIQTAPANEQEADAEFGGDFPGLLEAPLLTEDPLLDDPVASGGDSSLYSTDDDDTEQDAQTDDTAVADPSPEVEGQG
jgi:hypothetical protein